MSFDGKANFAIAPVIVAPTPAVSGLTVTVLAGQGSLFSGTPPYNLTAWEPLPPLGQPTKAFAEIVRVEKREGDTFTFSGRAQEGTTAKPIGPGWVIADTITVKALTDIEKAIEEGSTGLASEISARQAGDSTNATAISNEKTRAEGVEALKAPLASPALTGSPTAPTQTPGDNSTKLATTAFSAAAVAVEKGRAETAEATKASSASLTSETSAREAADATNATAISTEKTRAEGQEVLKAPLASPALTGTPTVPTATAGTSTTQVASTAFASTAKSEAESKGIPLTQKGAASGVAELTAGSKLPIAELPAPNAGGHYETNFGNGSASSFVIKHELKTLTPDISIVNQSTGQEEGCRKKVLNENEIELSATAWETTPPGAAAYRVSVDASSGLVATNGSVLTSYALKSEVGANSGIAPLEGAGKLPEARLPSSVVSDSAATDLCRGFSGVLPGDDITTPLQEAINKAAEDIAEGIAYSPRIYCSKQLGVYHINGPLRTGTAFGHEYAGQILLPALGSAFAAGEPASVIILDGMNTVLPGGANGPASGGWQLESNLASLGYVFDAIPAYEFFGATYPWTIASLIARDIILTLPANPQCGGFNMRCTTQSRPERCLVQSKEFGSHGPLGLTGTLEGWADPQSLNAGPHSRELYVRGLPIAMRLSEHGSLKLTAYYCKAILAAYQAAHMVNVEIDGEQCGTYFLLQSKTGTATGTGFDIDGSIDMEYTGSAPAEPIMFAEGNGSVSGRLALNIKNTQGGTLGAGAGVTLSGLDIADLARSTGQANGQIAGWRNQHPSDRFMRFNGNSQEAGAPGLASPSLHPWRVPQGAGWLTAETAFPTSSFTVVGGTYRASGGQLFIRGVGKVSYGAYAAGVFTGCTGGSGTAKIGTAVDPVLFTMTGTGNLSGVNNGSTINQALIPVLNAATGGKPRTLSVNGTLGTVASGSGAYGVGIFAQRPFNNNKAIWAALYSSGSGGTATLGFGIGAIEETKPQKPSHTVELALKTGEAFLIQMEILYKEGIPAQVNVFVNGVKEWTYELTSTDQKAIEQTVIPSILSQTYEDGFWTAPEDTTTILGSTGAMGTGFVVKDAFGAATLEERLTELVSGYPTLLTPLFQGDRYVPISTAAIGTPFKWIFQRVRVRENGTLKSLYSANGTVHGEIRAAILDCGKATAGEYTVLWEGAAVAMGGTSSYQLVGEPNLVVKGGEELMFAFAPSSAEATFGNVNGSGASGFDQLPATPHGATSAVLPKIIASHTTASLSLGGVATKIVESTLVIGGTPIVLLGYQE